MMLMNHSIMTLTKNSTAIDVLGDRRYDAVFLQPLSCKRRGPDLRAFGNDFAQAALDREENTTHLFEAEVSDFQFNPPPLQRQRLSIDPQENHSSHAQFWSSRIKKDYANRHFFSQQPHIPSPHHSNHLQSPWL